MQALLGRFRHWARGAPSQSQTTEGLTSGWIPEKDLVELPRRYGAYETPPLGYATVRDFADSLDHLGYLARAQGDLKDVQRPWALKAILGRVPRGSRLLEIGAGQPYVADILSHLGYEVWLVDPYDGSGNGPLEFDYFQRVCPRIRFVREMYSDELAGIPDQAFDCIYSISVLEHIDHPGLAAVARGVSRHLSTDGCSIHAVDHVLRGIGADEHLETLREIVRLFGLRESLLATALDELTEDTETYYLSAESHNRWRGSVPYDEFPMRVCASIHLTV
jgi:2-polyprenyl-3-methyl-5-hydroxy-6-metoxy-1,4-benzoquinol methylase